MLSIGRLHDIYRKILFNKLTDVHNFYQNQSNSSALCFDIQHAISIARSTFKEKDGTYAIWKKVAKNLLDILNNRSNSYYKIYVDIIKDMIEKETYSSFTQKIYAIIFSICKQETLEQLERRITPSQKISIKPTKPTALAPRIALATPNITVKQDIQNESNDEKTQTLSDDEKNLLASLHNYQIIGFHEQNTDYFINFSIDLNALEKLLLTHPSNELVQYYKQYKKVFNENSKICVDWILSSLKTQKEKITLAGVYFRPINPHTEHYWLKLINILTNSNSDF